MKLLLAAFVLLDRYSFTSATDFKSDKKAVVLSLEEELDEIISIEEELKELNTNQGVVFAEVPSRSRSNDDIMYIGASSSPNHDCPGDSQMVTDEAECRSIVMDSPLQSQDEFGFTGTFSFPSQFAFIGTGCLVKQGTERGRFGQYEVIFIDPERNDSEWEGILDLRMFRPICRFESPPPVEVTITQIYANDIGDDGVRWWDSKDEIYMKLNGVKVWGDLSIGERQFTWMTSEEKASLAAPAFSHPSYELWDKDDGWGDSDDLIGTLEISPDQVKYPIFVDRASEDSVVRFRKSWDFFSFTPSHSYDVYYEFFYQFE